MFRKLDNFWFVPMVPERLAILRMITGVFSLWYLTSRFDLFLRVADGSIDVYDPVGLAFFLDSPISVGIFEGLLWATIGLNILYIIGWKFKYTGPLFGVMLLFMMSYRNSWSMLYHNYNALVIHVLIIGFTASADVISLDRWMDKRKNWLEKGRLDWQYGWPIMLICGVTVVSYLLAGIAKLQGELAWAWVTGEAMRSQVAVDAIRKELYGSEASPFFRMFYPLTGIFTMAGVVSMILELGAPIAMVHRKLGMLWSVLTCLMHWGIYFIMSIHFPYHMGGFIFLAFFPLEDAWFWLKKKLFEPKEQLAKV